MPDDPPALPSSEPVEKLASPTEALWNRWYEWVTTHLGRDPERAAAAASAAADIAAQGSGFNRAADAARAAWVGREIQGVKNLHAERRSPHPWLSGLGTLVVAVGVEIWWLGLPACEASSLRVLTDSLLYAPAVLVVGGILTAALMRIYNRAGCFPQLALIVLALALATGVFLSDSFLMFGATFCNGPTF